MEPQHFSQIYQCHAKPSAVATVQWSIRLFNESYKDVNLVNCQLLIEALASGTKLWLILSGGVCADTAF